MSDVKNDLEISDEENGDLNLSDEEELISAQKVNIWFLFTIKKKLILYIPGSRESWKCLVKWAELPRYFTSSNGNVGIDVSTNISFGREYETVGQERL